MAEINSYYRPDLVEAAVSSGAHRDFVGGLWDEIGALQLDFMKGAGLLPSHTLLDVGCGAMRGGVHFVPFLAPGHYFGLDLNEQLLEAGYQCEIVPRGLADRLPRGNLIADPNFEVGRFGRRFDRALAVSLFTHLPLDLIRVCLEKMAPVLQPGGIFYATFFEASEGVATHLPITHQPGGIVSHAGVDPYHQRVADFAHLIRGLPLDLEPIGSFGHPRSQKMLAFVRRSDE